MKSTKDKKEHNIGVLLILMVFIIGIVLASLNVNAKWESRCESGEPFVYHDTIYACKKILK